MSAAAFFNVDGTLVDASIVHAFAWYARHQPTLTGSVTKTLKAAASLPLFAVADRISRRLFNELFYTYYAGEPEDRLHVLADELFERAILPRIHRRAGELLAQAKKAGLRRVIVSGGLDLVVRPLARHLEVDDFIASSLEFDRGYATGRLQPPFVGGPQKAALVRDYAERHGLDLRRCHAYAASYADYAMLSVVGHPTVVNPDLRLRAIAGSYGWPVLHLAPERDDVRSRLAALTSRLADRIAPD